jgi:8-oxo-dGTP diphosphatase
MMAPGRGTGPDLDPDVEVVAAAVLHHGRVLAARRVHPADVSGGWELPGGKVDAGETSTEAVVREVREELGCTVEVGASLEGRVAIKPGYALTVQRVHLVEGEPVPHEHDAVRWLGPEELDDVAWLTADQPFLPELRRLLLDGEPLEGGNVGVTVRIGRTVRRATGSWTESVHTLLSYLRTAGFAEVPQVHGRDERGREVLSFLAGRVPDVDNEILEDAPLADAMRWLRRFHEAVADLRIAGSWRTTNRPLAAEDIICHHDFAPYNVALSTSVDGERLSGVFDWDMAGPGTALEDVAFAAWNWVPLWRDLDPVRAAERLELIATAYGACLTAERILDAVPARLQRALDVILAGQAAGDPGMLNLRAVGEPDRSARALAALERSVPAIREHLVPGG